MKSSCNATFSEMAFVHARARSRASTCITWLAHCRTLEPQFQHIGTGNPAGHLELCSTIVEQDPGTPSRFHYHGTKGPGLEPGTLSLPVSLQVRGSTICHYSECHQPVLIPGQARRPRKLPHRLACPACSVSGRKSLVRILLINKCSHRCSMDHKIH
jgi:hypothetical protein